MNIYQPYTYLIGWSEHSLYYYGVRYANNCHPNDLWAKYFTSSKFVSDFRQLHGEPDVIQVRKTFDNPESAKIWEGKVLQRLDAKNHPNLINRANPGAYGTAIYKPHHVPWNKGVYGYPVHTDESKQKIREANIGKTLSGETKDKLSAIKQELVGISNGHTKKYINRSDPIPDGWYIGCSEETYKKISDSLSGIPKPPRTKEHSNNISKANKGKSKPNQSKVRKGGKWICNPVTGETSYLCNDRTIPDGWKFGRKP